LLKVFRRQNSQEEKGQPAIQITNTSPLLSSLGGILAPVKHASEMPIASSKGLTSRSLYGLNQTVTIQLSLENHSKFSLFLNA